MENDTIVLSKEADAAGVILGSSLDDRNLVYSVMPRCKDDRNIAVIGLSGETAKDTFTLPFIRQVSKAKESIVIYDDGGGLYQSCSRKLKKCGYEITHCVKSDDINWDRVAKYPCAVFITVPSFDRAFLSFAGNTIGQIAAAADRTALENGGDTPVRVNFLLNEYDALASHVPNAARRITCPETASIRCCTLMKEVPKQGLEVAETITLSPLVLYYGSKSSYTSELVHKMSGLSERTITQLPPNECLLIPQKTDVLEMRKYR